MAENYVIKKNTLDEIGNAIREKTGGTELIPAEDMADQLRRMLDWANIFASVTSNTCKDLIFPEGTTKIRSYSFWGTTNLVTVILPASVKNIYQFAFRGCTALEVVTFNGSVRQITGDTFSSCENLTTIRVPWSEGDVSGAPWGASNATIIYNYTGEK